jgi:hypothetical protein
MKGMKKTTDRVTFLMSPEALGTIEYLRADAGGFQRKIIPAHVNKIACVLQSRPDAYQDMPCVLAAKIPGRKRLVSMDGQHITHAAIKAGVPLYVTVVDRESVEHARWLFLPLNKNRRNLPWHEILAGSTCPAAKFHKDVAEEFGASWDHVARILRGLLSGKGTRLPDYDKRDTDLSRDVRGLARLILEIWTDDERWKPETFRSDEDQRRSTIPGEIINKNEDIYCVPGLLHSVAAVLYNYDSKPNDADARGYVESARDQDWTAPDCLSGACGNGMEYWCKLVDEFMDEHRRAWAKKQRKAKQTS